MNFRLSKNQIFGFNEKSVNIWTRGGHYFSGKLVFNTNLPEYVVNINGILLNVDDIVAIGSQTL
jgi:hypothetical protein